MMWAKKWEIEIQRKVVFDSSMMVKAGILAVLEIRNPTEYQRVKTLDDIASRGPQPFLGRGSRLTSEPFPDLVVFFLASTTDSCTHRPIPVISGRFLHSKQ
jgi:hypothetical protein